MRQLRLYSIENNKGIGNIRHKNFILKDIIAKNIPWYHKNKKNRVVSE